MCSVEIFGASLINRELCPIKDYGLICFIRGQGRCFLSGLAALLEQRLVNGYQDICPT